jgi:hypothetical protein
MFKKSECEKIIHFVNENDEIISSFNISKKRVYHSIIDLMVTDLNTFTNLNTNFLDNILELNDIISNKEINNREEFKDILKEIFIDNVEYKDLFFNNKSTHSFTMITTGFKVLSLSLIFKSLYSLYS